MRVTMSAALLLAAVALPATAQLSDPIGPETRLLGEVDPQVRKATAIVNGDIITDTDIDQRLNLVLAANRGRVPDDEKARLRLQVVRNLIDEKLQIQEAKTHDVAIEGKDIDSAFARVAKNFNRSGTAFDSYLREQGSSPVSLKAQIHAELAWSRLLRRRVEPFINVGDEEVRGIIAKLEAAKGKDEFRVGEIFLSTTPDNQAEVEANARRIVEQVRAGSSFVAYARQFSEASTAAVGGDLGWVRGEQLSEALGPVVAGLRAGAISDPIPVPGGIAIVALVEKRQVLAASAGDATLNLKQLSLPFPPGMSEADADAKVRMLQAATRDMGGCGRAEATAKTVGAEVTTNDALKIKDLPAALQDVMAKLPVGGATPPFGSRTEGIRVLVLCGRDDAPTEVAPPSFDEVYAQINDTRVNMMARRYLRDLRRDAVIDYR